MNHRVARYWRSIFLLLGVLLFSGHAVAREVRVGVYENMPKIFTDADGKPTGILIDVLQEVASREDWQLKFVICAWQTCLDKLVAGEIDLMPDLAYSAERDQLFDFHRTPALYSWSQLYRRVDVTISSPLDLQGKKIVFLDGAIQEQGLTAMLDAFGVKPRMQPKKSLEDAFAAAQRGEADAVVANHYYGDLKSHQFGLVDTPVVFQPARLFYATAQGKNSWLLSAIDEYLVEWMQDQNSPYFKIIKHWGGEVPQETVPTHLWSVLGIAIGLMLVLSMFTLVLRRQVDLKTKQLAEKSANLSATLNAIPDLLFEVDLDGRYCEIHASRAELLAAPKSDLIGKKISDILPREAANICMDALQQANSQGWAGGYQIELPLPQGKSWFELSVAKKTNADHASPRFIVMSRDVTARAVAELRLQRLTQLYAALSQCNQAIVRCSNESELFPQICSDAVTFGGMKMAWIGLLDQTTGMLVPVASFGSGTEYLDGIKISIDGSVPTGQGPTGTAVRENHPVWCQDFVNDPNTAVWHERAIAFNWAASASLPLVRRGEVVAALTLYADEVDAFDEAARNLLIEMAMDISFALERFEDELVRQQTELKVQWQTDNLASLLHVSQTLAGTLNLQEVLQNSTAYIANLTHLDSSAIYLYQDEAHLQLGATTPPLPSDFPGHLRMLPLADHPHVQQAIATRQPVLFADTLAAPLTDAEAEVTRLRGLRTVLYLPLVTDSKLLGVMIVASTSRAVVLDESEIELCRTMANLAAVAVNNAQLFETVQQTKTKIALQARRAEALLALPIAAETMSERDFMQFGADLAEQLTESHIAFIHLVYDDQQTIELGSWSHATQQHYCHAAYDNHYPIDEAGIWADALRQRVPVVFNDYTNVTHKHGLPEGHATLDRLISVPVIDGGLVRMMVGVGNKAATYDELDIETVQLVANTVWRIVAKTRAMQALKTNENKLEAILDGVEAHIYIKGTDYRYQYANRRVCELFDKNLSDIIGREDSELFDAATADRLRGSDKRVIEGGERVAEEEVNSNAIGNVTKAFLTVKIPLRNSDGSIYALCGISTDITERKRMEDSLLKLSVAVEQSPSSIVITDLDANIVYANATFVQQTGYMLDEIIGQNPRMLHSGKTSRATYDELWAHLMRGEKWQGELINRRKDGSEYIEAVRISPVRDGGGKVVNYLAIKDDITEKKQAEARIQQLAHFDQLTGLPNRTLLQDHFKFALSLAQRSGEHLAIMFLDLDHFKNINDTLGHGIGDLLLMEVAKRLMLAVREEDTVSRLGGDEFIFILPGTDAIGAAHVAKKLIEIISVPYLVEQHELITTPSIGIAIYPEDGTDMETLSKNADAAMYQVKQANRNDFRFFTPAMQTNSVRNLRLGSDLRHALAREQLTLVYQPQIAMQDGRTVGAEALLRWQHPELGTISPAEFIPIAEASGLIIQIGEWVLRTAATQMKVWLDKGLPSMVVAVNLSAVQFRHANLVKMVSDILTETGLPANSLELELTEAVAMDDPQAAVAVMDKLYERGIRMSIDDFGTGYSSLSYLKRFKVYKLKIDQSFVHDISTDSEDKAIVSAIINMASSLGMHTIAEGVETAEQLAFLRLHGCDEVQGYYFSKPLTVVDFEKKMLNGGVLLAQ